MQLQTETVEIIVLFSISRNESLTLNHYNLVRKYQKIVLCNNCVDLKAYILYVESLTMITYFGTLILLL